MPPLSDALAHVVNGTPLPRSQEAIRRDLCPDLPPLPSDRDAEEAHRAGEVRHRAFMDMEQAVRSKAGWDTLENCWERVRAVSGWRP